MLRFRFDPDGCTPWISRHYTSFGETHHRIAVKQCYYLLDTTPLITWQADPKTAGAVLHGSTGRWQPPTRSEFMRCGPRSDVPVRFCQLSRSFGRNISEFAATERQHPVRTKRHLLIERNGLSMARSPGQSPARLAGWTGHAIESKNARCL